MEGAVGRPRYGVNTRLMPLKEKRTEYPKAAMDDILFEDDGNTVLPLYSTEP